MEKTIRTIRKPQREEIRVGLSEFTRGGAIFNVDTWMVAWTPGEPQSVKVGPWPDKDGWTDGYSFTTGCCELARQRWPLERKVMKMFIDFHTLTVRDGIDPRAAHWQFSKIGEYLRRISPDTPGAAPAALNDASESDLTPLGAG